MHAALHKLESDGLLHKEDLASQLHRVIVHKIVTREYPPGEKLSIQAVANTFGVSVTPVREAFKRLASEGLLVIQPRRGTTVAQVTPQDVAHLYEIRIMIESHAVRTRFRQATLTALKTCVDDMTNYDENRLYEDFELYWDYSSSDAEFHRLLVAETQNPRLLDIYTNLHTHSLIAPILFGLKAPQRGVEQCQEHLRILAALEAGDAEGASNAVELHLNHTLETLRNRWPTPDPK